MSLTSEPLAYILSLFGLLAPISLVIVLLVLASLSRRLGEVTRRRPLYRLFYVSAGLLEFGVIMRLMMLFAGYPPSSRVALLYDIPFVISLLLAVTVAWAYWGWLLYEHENTEM